MQTASIALNTGLMSQTIIVALRSAAPMGTVLITRVDATPILPAILVLHHRHHRALRHHLLLQGLHSRPLHPDLGNKDVLGIGVESVTMEEMRMTSTRHHRQETGLVDLTILNLSVLSRLI